MRVLLFDFDGVVADSFDVFFTEVSAACRELGYYQLDSKEALLKIMETNAIVGLARAGFPLRKLRKLGKEFAPRIKAANERILPFPEMVELLGELGAAHPLYIITSNQTPAVAEFVEKFGIGNVREILGSDKESSKVKKIKKVVKRHKGADAFYIGDTKGDMIEGRSAKVTTVAVSWGWHPEETLLAGKPDHLVRTPMELRALLLR